MHEHERHERDGVVQGREGSTSALVVGQVNWWELRFSSPSPGGDAGGPCCINRPKFVAVRPNWVAWRRGFRCRNMKRKAKEKEKAKRAESVIRRKKSQRRPALSLSPSPNHPSLSLLKQRSQGDGPWSSINQIDRSSSQSQLTSGTAIECTSPEEKQGDVPQRKRQIA
jgi:hypothetical protein